MYDQEAAWTARFEREPDTSMNGIGLGSLEHPALGHDHHEYR